MAPDWERVRALFHDALERDPEEQAALLRAAAAADERLATEVASLLAAHESAHAFLDAPALPAVMPPASALASSSPLAASLPTPSPASSSAASSRDHSVAASPRLTPGDRLGAFEILGPAGRGGMGEVYKARDLRLDRIVAIKVVSDRHGQEPRARARFEREARAISRLSHPHICTLHDVGIAAAPDQREVPFLVMEFLEGRTLADRLRDGVLPPADALRHGLAIVQALAAAHAQGIVHRDLKPANIMLTAGGVKLLDFGLAQLRASAIPSEVMDEAGGPHSFASSLSSRGMIFGTLRYMSPEQLRGEPTDRRSDIFSCGAVLHEMLTGRSPFDERDDASVIAAVLTKPAPPIATSDARVNEACARIVGRCLEKVPARRWSGMEELGAALADLVSSISGAAPEQDDARAGGGSRARLLGSNGASRRAADAGTVRARALRAASASSRRLLGGVRRITVSARRMAGRMAARRAVPKRPVSPVRRVTRAVLVLAILLVSTRAAFMFAGQHYFATSGPRAARLSIIPPDGVRFDLLQISPDGRTIAFTGWTTEGTRVWLRPLDAADARAVPGTFGARGPLIWSPDSRRLAFMSGETMLVLDTVTGATSTVTEAGAPYSGSWSVDNVILYDAGKSTREGIWRVPATGGEPKPVLLVDHQQGEIAVMFPQFLPDGERFLFSVHSADPQIAGVYIGSLSKHYKRKRVLTRPTPAMYLSSGHLIFASDSGVMTQRFNVDAEELLDEPVPIVQADRGRSTRRNTLASFSGMSGPFSASQTGTIVHTSAAIGLEQLAWHDRTGRRMETVGEPGDYTGFALSKDDTRVVASRTDGRGRPWNLWMMDLARGTSTRMTFAANDQTDPRWSPDGRRLVVSATRRDTGPDEPGALARDAATRDGGPKALASVGLDGVESLLYRDPTRSVSVDDWSPDGKLLLYHVDRDRALLAVPIQGDQSPHVIWRSPSSYTPDQARFSPDGRWVAYHSQESGRPEIYVTRFPEGGERWQVSTAGGVQPIWRADGRELFYLGLDSRLFAVPFGARGGVQPSTPRALFQTALAASPHTEQYAVDRTGQRFLLLEPDPRVQTSVIDVVLNWTEARPMRATEQ